MRRAAIIGLEGIAIADDNSVAGIVRAHTEARKIKRPGGRTAGVGRGQHGLLGPQNQHICLIHRGRRYITRRA